MNDDFAKPWRVTDERGRVTHFYSEIGARTGAALRVARAGRAAVRVEHRTDDLGWHDCPGAERLHAVGRESPEARPAPWARPRTVRGRWTRLPDGRRDGPDPDGR